MNISPELLLAIRNFYKSFEPADEAEERNLKGKKSNSKKSEKSLAA